MTMKMDRVIVKYPPNNICEYKSPCTNKHFPALSVIHPRRDLFNYQHISTTDEYWYITCSKDWLTCLGGRSDKQSSSMILKFVSLPDNSGTVGKSLSYSLWIFSRYSGTVNGSSIMSEKDIVI